VVTRVTPLQHPPHAPTSACSQQLRKRTPSFYFVLAACTLLCTIIIPLASACVGVSVTVHASRRGGPPRGRRGRISSICGAEWRGRGG
ncbi:MAG: hypothetical protein ACK53Y_20890, partial [bacterium]